MSALSLSPLNPPENPEARMYDADTVFDDSAYDASDDHTYETPDADVAGEGTPLRWPPPGLESLQGLAWRAIMLLAAGTGIMIAPMLISVATAQSFWSIGLFGESWWVPVVCALVGLLILLSGMERLTRVLFDGAKAVQRGHDWATVAFVASDARHDAGFLLQGARQYASLEERDRRMLLAARVVAVICYATSLLWIPIAFTFGVFLAGRGIIGGGGALASFVLFPGGLLLIAAVLAHVFETRTTRGMARAWRRDTGREVHLLDEVSEWRADRATRLIHLTPATRRTIPARAFAIVLILIAALLPLPITTLALATAMGPVLAQLAVPRLDTSAARIAKTMMLEPYALPADSTMSPMEAGEALHALSFTGTRTIRSAVEREPVRRYDAWPRESKPVTMPNIEAFGTQVIPRAMSLTLDEIAYLERIAAYPALTDLSRVARARAADITGARWNTTALASTSVFELPVPRFAGLRDATQFHTAKAVLQLANGDTAGAELTLREVISVGLLVVRESPTLIDVLVGTSIAANGAAALQALYNATGRSAEADALRRPQEGIETMASVTRALRPDGEGNTGLRRSMSMTSDEALPRGMRWEGLMALQIGAGCLNPHTVVFGQGQQYDEWIEETRASLVRYPSEQALFDLTMRGPVVPAELRQRANIVEGLLGLTLGRAESAATCAALLAGMSD